MARPVPRCRIDNVEVILQRYTPMCGDSGLLFVLIFRSSSAAVSVACGRKAAPGARDSVSDRWCVPGWRAPGEPKAIPTRDASEIYATSGFFPVTIARGVGTLPSPDLPRPTVSFGGRISVLAGHHLFFRRLGFLTLLRHH